MIILAPEPGPMIAGFLLPNVNTRESGSRCRATEFAASDTHAGIEKMYDSGKINKARGQGAGNTPTALTQPAFLGPQKPQEKGGQADMKPMAPSYRLRCTSDNTSGCQPVAIMTVTSAVTA